MSNNKFIEKNYSKINFATVNDIITDWNKSVDEFSSAVLKANDDPTFKVLEALGISGGFPGNYDRAIQSIINSLTSEIEGAKSAIENIEGVDLNLRKKFPTPPPSGNVSGTDNGYSEEEVEEDTTIDNTEAQKEFYSKLSVVDLSGLVNILNKASSEYNLSIDEIFNNEENGSKVIKTILESPNISEDYKKILLEGKTEVSLTILKSFVNGDFKETIGFDDQNTVLTIKTYLANISKDYATGDNAVASIDANQDKIIKVLLEDMKPVSSYLNDVNNDNIQKKISSIYYGDVNTELKNINKAQDFVRSNVDIISKAKNIYYEDLLSDNKNKELLLNNVDKLKRVTLYTSMLEKCKNNSKILLSLIK